MKVHVYDNFDIDFEDRSQNWVHFFTLFKFWMVYDGNRFSISHNYNVGIR